MNQNNNQQQQQQPPQTDKPIPEYERIRDRKRQVIDVLQKKFNEQVWRERLLKICGGDESRIMKSLNSFITYIMNDDGGEKKKYIADCAISTISTSFLEAFQMGIEVGGGRDHAYLVNYAGQCELEISYKGFVYALSKHFDNPFIISENVFDGDEFTSQISGNNAIFTHTPKDPFSKTWDTLRGCYCYFSYTQRDNKEKVSRLVMIQKTGPDGLDMIRSKAKSSFAWKDFEFEQAKKATLRRAAKIPFASIDFGDEDVNPETIDNRHYMLESANSSEDRLKLLMEKQQELYEDDKPKTTEKNSNSAPVNTGTAAKNNEPPAESVGNGNTVPPVHNDASVNATPLSQAPAEGEIIENEPKYADLSDDDFNNDGEDRSPTNGQGDNNPAQSAHTHGGGDNNNIAESPANAAPTAEAVAGAVWDGKSVFVSPGKAQQRDFATALQACVYLKKVISNRNTKASRLELISLNPVLIAAVIKAGNGAIVAELHKIADEGK